MCERDRRGVGGREHDRGCKGMWEQGRTYSPNHRHEGAQIGQGHLRKEFSHIVRQTFHLTHNASSHGVPEGRWGIRCGTPVNSILVLVLYLKVLKTRCKFLKTRRKPVGRRSRSWNHVLHYWRSNCTELLMSCNWIEGGFWGYPITPCYRGVERYNEKRASVDLTHTHTHTHTHPHTHTHTHTHTCTCAHTHTHTHPHTDLTPPSHPKHMQQVHCFPTHERQGRASSHCLDSDRLAHLHTSMM